MKRVCSYSLISRSGSSALVRLLHHSVSVLQQKSRKAEKQHVNVISLVFSDTSANVVNDGILRVTHTC